MTTGPERWRGAAAVILIVLGCLTATVAVPVVWLNRVVLDTDTYVDTVGPLSDDPAIKDAIAAKVTDELFQKLGAEDLTRKVLPDDVDFLAGPILGATEGFVDGQVRKELDSPGFSTLWKEANRDAHDLATRVLLGEGGAVSAEDGKVSVDLAGLFETVKSKLAERGIDLFKDVSLEGPDTQLTLFQSQGIVSLQRYIRTLDRLATWLPVIALSLLGAAILVSASRMKTVFRIGLGLSAGMVLLLVFIALARSSYLDALSRSGSVDIPAATAFFDIITGSLKSTLRRIFLAGLVVAAAGFLFGPYPPAVSLRRNAISLYRTGKDTGAKVDLLPAETWVRRYRTLLRAAGIMLALVIPALMDQPTIAKVAAVAVALGVYLGVIELLARRAQAVAAQENPAGRGGKDDESGR